MADNTGENGVQEQLLASHLTLRRIMGLLGILLPLVLIVWGVAISGTLQNSISDYYALRTRDALVGTLVVIGFFLCVYRGYDRTDNVAGFLGCIFALGVAFFPNKPDGWQSVVHFVSAACLFFTLSFFSMILFTKTIPSETPVWWRRILNAFRFGSSVSAGSQTPRKVLRNRIYVYCGIIILLCIALCGLYSIFWKDTGIADLKPVFWLESFMIWAFGLSWFVKGDWLWLLKDRE